ncbi:hypothetical protein [Paenibacillus sp. FSL R7-0337]|uniref:hypothetical protein n=1 Tax=Paenibacillus sp. FSL R7-0337 TaxID=1926588 RepID=UPI00096DCD68|nr:hypothetical protein [Paenibacillus sp. FSL R7-0337]OMF99299.1 hypothetical protein BK147_06895 [Paenibacillus sp. FSL R7-0337]
MTRDSLAITDPIKAPKSIQTLIAILIPIIFLSLSPGLDPDRHFFLYYFRLGWIGVCCVAFLFILVNALRKEGRLQWGTDSLIIRNEHISASGIKVIYIDGPLVGILPAGKRIVPVNLCFRFTEDTAAVRKRLMNWAEENGIRLKYKRFVKWL